MALSVQNSFCGTLLLLLFAGTTLPTPTRAQQPDSLSRTERWRADVDSLTAFLVRRHVAPFAHRDSAQWMRSAERLKSEIPDRSDLQVTLGLMQLVAALGDSHTQLVPWLSMTTHGYPFDLRGFDEGYYVTRARPGYESLLGARLVRIGDTPATRAFEQVSTLYASDNRSHRWHFVLPYLRMAEPLHGLELLTRRNRGTFTFEMPDGTRQTRTLRSEPSAGRPLFAVDSLWTRSPSPEDRPRAWQRTDENYWFDIVGTGPSLYVQYNSCRDDPNRPFDAFVAEIQRSLADRKLERVVIDLRHNSGGDSNVIRPLYEVIEQIDAPLFVIIGRGTFSSGLLNAMTLEDKYGATLVGEPTSGKPAFFGETRIFRLPHSNYPVLYSTKSFRRGPKNLQTVSPHVSVSVTPEDYFAGTDPVLETVLSGDAGR